MYRKAERVIMCWAMGVTQHRHSVPTVQKSSTCNCCAVTSVSLAQASRRYAATATCRVTAPWASTRNPGPLARCPGKTLPVQGPREHGDNAVLAIKAMEEKRAKVFIGLGQLRPGHARYTAHPCGDAQLRTDGAHRHQAQPLAPVTGRDALILPCLGRTEIDLQAEGPQGVTVEDTFSMVHISHGQLKPRSPHLRSEPAIIAGMAKATLGNHPIDWEWVIGDYGRIRELIADVIPGFADFNTRLAQPGGFHLGNAAADRTWNTATGKAQFTPSELPEQLVNAKVLARGDQPDLILQTLRSHDQYNTTLYGLDDRYRGVFGLREVVFVNEADIRRLGFEPGEQVDMVSLWEDGRERRVSGFRLVAYDLPEGQAAAYYPETNPLVPLESYGEGTYTPTSKFVAIKLQKARADNRIEVSHAD